MKPHISRVANAVLFLLVMMATGAAQQTNSSAGTPTQTVPPLIQFSNVASDEGGNTMSGVVSITFSLYSSQLGGDALWTETQNNVQLDATGRYSVQLGITKPNGVPTSLFTSGEARWLGIQIAEQPPQTRVLLLSVPYALKAGDAATIGGLPPSAFMLAASPSGNPSTTGDGESTAGSENSSAAVTAAPSTSSSTSSDVTTTGGTVGTIAAFSTSTNIQNSLLTQTGKTAINVAGQLNLPTTGTATSSAGFDSRPLDFVASSYNSSSDAAVAQTFQWQAEPADNDTATPSGTLNLLFGSGTNKPEETGLHIANNGQIIFAAGQTFPGTGDGTITGVTTASGSGLSGGGTSGTLVLSLTNACAANQVLQWSGSAWTCSTLSGGGTITGVTAGTDLTGGGTSGNVTLNLNTSALNSTYAQLTAANTFTGNQMVSGNLSATGVVTGSGYQIGSNLFAFGSYANGNAFLGFAGNSSMSGVGNTASGQQALFSDTTGSGNTASGSSALLANTTGSANIATGSSALYSNTSGGYNAASGYAALYSNTTGSYNAASGEQALFNNTTGSYNTATGFMAGETADNSAGTGSNNTAVGANIVFSTGSLTNATAIGANSEVSENNALVLGCVVGWDNCANAVNVGIGTTAPVYALDVYGSGHFTQPVTFGSPVNFASGQTFPGTGTITGVTANTGLTGGGTSGTVSLALATNACASGSALTALPFTCAAFATTGANTFTASQSVQGNLSAAGTVTGASVTATGAVSGGTVNATNSFSLGGTPFASGSYANSNAFLGFAGNTTMTGGANTASGTNALASNTTGSANTASGTSALASNTTGSANTASGYEALNQNTTGSYNTASGTWALIENTTGTNNTAVGNQVLFHNTAGSYNTASGNFALFTNTTGTNNTAVGNQALYSNGPGADYNTAVGNVALYYNTGGFWNTATGAAALNANTTGASNTADGLNALLDNTTGSNNTGVGYQALWSNGTGSYNTGVGYQAGTDSSYPNLTNATAIGSNAWVAESNALVLGCIAGMNNCNGAVNVGIGTEQPSHVFTIAQGLGDAYADGWSTYSSRRWKTNIKTLPDALAKVEQLRGVSYDLTNSGRHEIGVIAEEVGQVVPEVVTYEKNGKDAQGVDYSRLTALLIEAVKQQERQINAQQSQMTAQRRQIRSQQSQIALLTDKVGVLETALRTAGRAEKSLATVCSAAKTDVVRASTNPSATLLPTVPRKPAADSPSEVHPLSH